ncbi:MAG: hypothetical protein RIT28_3933 [Pseudomonadota bacterium]
MATPTQTAAKEARLSARSEQDFADLIAQVLIDERDAEKVVDFLTKLNVPKVYEPGTELVIKPEGITSASDFDVETEISNGFVKFTDRHVRKLKWHVSHPALDGVEQVIVLYRSVGYIAQLRISRILHLLKERETLTTFEWGMARELLNRTYRDFRQATSIVTQAWLDALKESNDSEAVKVALTPLPQIIRNQSNVLAELRDQLERARLTLAVKPDGYPPVRPPRYFGGDLLDSASWKHFWGEVHIMADNLNQHVLN